MAIPKTLSYNDLFGKAPEYGNLQKGARTVTALPDKTKDKDKKKKKKKSNAPPNSPPKTQQRIGTTSIGKGTPRVGGYDDFSGFYEIENPDKSNKRLLVEGMQNRSPSKASPRNPTLYQMLPRQDDYLVRYQGGVARSGSGAQTQGFNFANPSFSQPRAPKEFGTQRVVKSYQDSEGNRRLEYSAPIYTTPVSARAQSARSRGAAQSVQTQIGSMKKLYSGIESINPNKSIWTPSKEFGGTQDLFSQNIKLASAGFALTDTKARKAVQQTQASLKAAAKKRNTETLKRTLAFHSSPQSGIAEANRILAEQGANYRFRSESRRIRRGNYEAYITKYYVGPSTRTSYTRIIHNGRRVTAYRGYAPGQLMGRGDPYSVINKHHKDAAVYDFAIQNTEFKPTGKYYDTSLNASAIASRITQLNSLKNRTRKQYYRVPASYKRVSLQSRGTASLVRRYGAPVKRGRYWYVVTGYRSGYHQVHVGLSAAEKKELATLNAQRPKAGGAGKAAFVAHVEREAGKKKKVLDTMIDPLDSIYSYAAVTDEQIADFEKYGGDLKTNITEFDTNIETLQQGIAKVNVARGIATPTRRLGERFGKAGNIFDAIETKEVPFDLKISSETTQLANIGNELTDVRSEFAKSYGAQAVGKKEGVVSTAGNRTINATGGYRGKSTYSPRTGSTVIKIPKDKIPANGKVVIEATISYSGYAGKTVTSLGTVHGGRNPHYTNRTTVRKELPVDANGNVTISASMTGNKRPWLTKTGLSGIKIIDPSSTKAGAQLLDERRSLLSQQSNLTSSIKEDKSVKSYFDSAQEFLLGNKSSLTDTKGKKIASYAGGKLNILDQTGFKDVYGDIGGDIFGAARTIQAPITKIDASITSISSTLPPTSPASLKTQIAAAKRRVTSYNKAAAGVQRLNHTKIEVRTSARNEKARHQRSAAAAQAQVNALTAELARAESPSYYNQAQLTERTAKVSNLRGAKEFLGGGTQELSIGGKVVAKRGQAGMIDVLDQSAFTNLGITIPKELLKQRTSVTSTKFSVLEKAAEDRQKTQAALIAELKNVQKARIKENAAARVAQINRLVETRTINRREAAKMRTDIAKEVAASNKAITGVDDSVPIPDITEFDTDLRSEAQKILGETEGIVKGTKLAKAKARLRQVTRGRRPQGSPVGAVLKVGAVTPRPRQQQRNTSLPPIVTNLRNPFVR